jgi:hypothetical protein
MKCGAYFGGAEHIPPGDFHPDAGGTACDYGRPHRNQSLNSGLISAFLTCMSCVRQEECDEIGFDIHFYLQA